MTWILAFIFLGEIHANGTRMSEAECRDLLQITPGNMVCINGINPKHRIYRDKEIKNGQRVKARTAAEIGRQMP